MKPPRAPVALLVFLGAAAAALAFAAYSNHVWEDYYITYRSSKNLATGHGLVFQPGEKLHTFTSPLGVLLPALASLLTGNSSDTAALWIFRVMSAAAFGGAAVLLLQFTRRLGYAALAAAFAVLAIATDAKSLDFTINGMETAFMLLFLAYAVWAQLAPGPRQWMHLGAAWAGLMWTRPDSFVYVAAVAIGFWLFNDPAASGHNRRALFVLYLRAALLTTALYLPWLAWANWYYGTPIPHTISAKGSLTAGQRDLVGLLLTFVKLPWLAWREFATPELTWLPSYEMIGGWPAGLRVVARVLGTICALAWLVPGLRRETRAASFAYFGAHVYLTYFPYFPFPWYVPPTTLLAALVLAGLLQQAWTAARSRTKGLAVVPATLAGLLVAANLWLAVEVARQVEVQQRLVEDGNRRRIGEWLRLNADPQDRVFMEPLGYIGFFSGLKTFDYPGMSSLEVVEARRTVGEDWAMLVQYLQPEWVVLRPFEATRISYHVPSLLQDNYQETQVFDQTEAVQRENVRGRPYLEHDAKFTLYRLKKKTRFDSGSIEITCPFPATVKYIAGIMMLEVHAQGRMSMRVPGGAEGVRGSYSFTPGAELGEYHTDGAIFRIELQDEGRTTVLLENILDPVARPDDRFVRHYDFALPSGRSPDAKLVFHTWAKGHSMQDWTSWSMPEFR